MKKTDVLIVGAGATGLLAAFRLLKADRSVRILEADSYTGGRIRTICSPPFTGYVELGAEFIHGNLPVTMALLDEAGISYHKTGGQFWQSKDGTLKQEEHFIDHWQDLVKKLQALQHDTSIADFLDTHFSGPQYAELRTSVIQFAEGYDTADTNRASSFALRDEWQEEDDAPQYRLDKGYGELIKYMEEGVTKLKGDIHLNSAVKEIHWAENEVRAVTRSGQEFQATKVIIAVPLNILQLGATEAGAISFLPAITGQQAAIKEMGMGAVIKILLQFSEPVWQDPAVQQRAANDLEKLSFLFSDETIPTWWTQYPTKSTLLTGWLGGSRAARIAGKSDEEILQLAIASLANILQLSPSFLSDRLTASHIANWTTAPYIQGSYSYATTGSKSALEVLNKPIANTIYFAGEAMYEGAVMGTVEAALASGQAVAERILILH